MIVLPRSDVLKQEILQKIAAKFEKDREYTEQEVNEIVDSFDVDDRTLVRRELVNFNYLGRDSGKGIYWLKKSALSKEDLAKIKANQERMVKRGILTQIP